jgi:CPA1 family monovalent cation:H+ antiporter
MTVFQTIAILLVFAALGSYVNRRVLKLPASIGLMFLALLLSGFAIGLAQLDIINLDQVRTFISEIDFSGILLHGMLSFLLFAGALHIDLGDLKKYRLVVAVLATVGVLIATFVTSTLVWLAVQALGFSFPYIDALLFGALIAPTDPVAVLGILKEVGVSRTLRVKIASESLFNDGVGVVVFLVILSLATAPGALTIDPYTILGMLAWQSLGAIALGLALGWLTYQMLHSIDDYKVELLLTMALAAGGYALAEFVDVSAPITTVVSGLLIGTQGRVFGMSDKTRKHLDMFWELIDEILNAVLFMLIGLQMMIMTISEPMLALGLCAIIAVLVGRCISVSVPITIMRMMRYKFEPGTIRFLTWGGLRGGISIALALSLPQSAQRDLILDMTYLVVVFSVIFQGTTFRHLVHKITVAPPQR